MYVSADLRLYDSVYSSGVVVDLEFPGFQRGEYITFFMHKKIDVGGWDEHEVINYGCIQEDGMGRLTRFVILCGCVSYEIAIIITG